MNKQCKNCSKTFRIDDQDISFYKKIDVPEPTLCQDCRQQRRLAWRNERKLYARSCDLCKANSISIYSPNKPYTVYCSDCWWSDKWDPYDFGIDYQSGKSFFEQMQELRLRVPRIALYGKNNENSAYSNHSDGAKNCYLAVDTGMSENVHYSKWMISCRDCADCYQLENAELAYESLYSVGPYQVIHTWFSDHSRDLTFAYNCHGATNCFLATNQRKQKYILRNQQLTEVEYTTQRNAIDTGSYTQYQELIKEFDNILRGTIRRNAEIIKSENCTGDNIYNCANVHDSFDVIESTNTRYCYDAGHLKDCYDVYESAFNCELQYETHGCNRSTFTKFSHVSYDNSFIEYCDSCHDSKNLFGCIGIRKGEYVILNKKYSQAEFEKLKTQIILNMRASGEYGEFFPMDHSPFQYYETVAQEYYPKKNSHNEIFSRHQATLSTSELPDNIRDVDDTITKQTIICTSCEKPFKYIGQEIALYKKVVVPLPRLCPDCRHLQRMARRNPRSLWQRTCMCSQTTHGHSGKCASEFSTTYAPDRLEIIYCQQCYQKEYL